MIDRNKPLKFYSTELWNESYGNGALAIFLSNIIKNEIWDKDPLDMYIFEISDPGYLKIHAGGYNFNNNELDETSRLYSIECDAKIRKFYLKIDELEDQYAAMFMFPEEYYK